MKRGLAFAGFSVIASVLACKPEVDEARFRRIVREELRKELDRHRKAEGKKAGPPAVQVSSGARRPVGLKPSGAGDGIREVAPNRFEVARSLLDQFIARAPRSVRVVPAIRDGKPFGFRLLSVRRGSLVRRLGFMNGDVVRTVNGFQITAPDQALKAFSAARNASQVTVAVERGGKLVTLTYVFK